MFADETLFDERLKRVGSREQPGRDAFCRAKLHRDRFDASIFGGEDFDVGASVEARLARTDVGGSVGHRFPAETVHCGDGSRTESEVVGSGPIGLVVSGFESGSGVVGDLVVAVSSGFQKIDGLVEEIRVAIFIGIEFSLPVAGEKFGVFFVGQIVSGKMVRSERDRLLRADCQWKGL